MRWLAVACCLPMLAASQEHADGQPVRRQHHALTYDPISRRVLLHGGISRSAPGTDAPPLSDLWAWDGSRWTVLAAASSVALVGHQLFVDSEGRLIVTAGSPRTVTAVWERQDWRVLSVDTARDRSLAAGTYDARRRRFVLFGGRIDDRLGGRARASDTWEFDGTAWHLVATDGPPRRMAAAMAFDEHRGAAVLFGGRDGPPLHGDTWTWDGVRWLQVATTGPEPRISAGMSYDARRRELVLFGGLGASGYLGDTWIWNGEAWRRAATDGPSPRVDGLLAYDSARGVTVLFGGAGDAGHGLSDTWEWDGRHWSRRDP